MCMSSMGKANRQNDRQTGAADAAPQQIVYTFRQSGMMGGYNHGQYVGGDVGQKVTGTTLGSDGSKQVDILGTRLFDGRIDASTAKKGVRTGGAVAAAAPTPPPAKSGGSATVLGA